MSHPSRPPHRGTHAFSPLAAALAAAGIAAASAAQAASVEVQFEQPDRYTDAERGIDAERVRGQVEQLLKDAGARWLPASQALTVKVLDIDLAGERRPSFRLGGDVRVMRGGVDWPRMKLHLTLREGDAVVADEDADIADTAYLQRSVGLDSGGPLRYEARMLDDWFQRRFAPSARASR